MLTTGIVSVTFRKLSVGEVASVSKKAALGAIEWGGDIHVPPMNEEAIRTAKCASDENGLKIASYGSYFNCTGDDEEMEKNLSTAAALGAPNIRIWAGKLWSNDYTPQTRTDFIKRIRHTVQCAAKHGLTVSPEFHQGTLTDELDSALRLVDEVGEDNFRLYWQPNQFKDDEYNLRAIKGVLPYLSNVHVFSWHESDMYPLVWGEKMWRQYLDVIRSDGKDHNLLLEFVCDGTVDQLYRDAETLHGWLR